MAERRLPFTVQDDEGASHRGEIVIVRAWRPDLRFDAGAAFTIVLAQEPLPSDVAPPAEANVAVCLPSVPVRLPAVAAEASAAYNAGDASAAPPVRLSATALSAYAQGRLLAGRSLAATPGALFQNSGRLLQLGQLAHELLASGRRTERCWNDLAAVLCWPDEAPARARPDWVRSRLARLLAKLPSTAAHDLERAASERLRAIERGAAPHAVANPVALLVEDAALLRCLLEQDGQALELSAMLAYLDGALPALSDAELATDRAFTREQLSFVILLQQPHQFERLRATFEIFRGRYTAVYVKHHADYWRGIERMQTELREAAAVARTLARLNALPALGRPVGKTQLGAYERLLSGRPVCDAGELRALLHELPSCPRCGISLRDCAPTKESRGVLRGLQSALARQQTRLASEAVRRILARGGERLDQFLRIVQATDLTALASVLDDDLLDFLRELLAEPVVPTPEALDLFAQLARAHPAISAEQIDEALALRQLLVEQLAVHKGTEEFRLAKEPSS